MGIFGKKRSVDVIDLSDMKKRGLLPDKIPNKDPSGVVDFSFDSSNISKRVGSDSDGSIGSDDFLSNLAGVGGGVAESPGNVTSSLRAARARVQSNVHVNELKLKIDDNEFKVGRLEERIKELERKLRELGV
jgi:hypothetical protein